MGVDGVGVDGVGVDGVGVDGVGVDGVGVDGVGVDGVVADGDGVEETGGKLGGVGLVPGCGLDGCVSGDPCDPLFACSLDQACHSSYSVLPAYAMHTATSRSRILDENAPDFGDGSDV